jgi:hypothetical protein
MIRSDRVSQPVLRFLFVCVLALAVPSPARAQTARPTPDRHLIGYGVDLGVLFPDDSLENTLTLDGYGEFYLTPRVSARAMFAWASPGISGRTEDHFRQVKLLFGANYNWVYQRMRPFAGGGAGAYFVRLKLDGQEDPEGERRGGIYFGGGSDIIIDEESAVKIEFRWDVISDPPGQFDATGPSLTFGYKRFF